MSLGEAIYGGVVRSSRPCMVKPSEAAEAGPCSGPISVVHTRRLGALDVCSGHARLLRDAGEIVDRPALAPITVSAPPAAKPASPSTGAPAMSRPPSHSLVLKSDPVDGTCRLVGCLKPATKRGFCDAGFAQVYRAGRLDELGLPMVSRIEQGKRLGNGNKAKATLTPAVTPTATPRVKLASSAGVGVLSADGSTLTAYNEGGEMIYAGPADPAPTPAAVREALEKAEVAPNPGRFLVEETDLGWCVHDTDGGGILGDADNEYFFRDEASAAELAADAELVAVRSARPGMATEEVRPDTSAAELADLTGRYEEVVKAKDLLLGRLTNVFRELHGKGLALPDGYNEADMAKAAIAELVELRGLRDRVDQESLLILGSLDKIDPIAAPLPRGADRRSTYILARVERLVALVGPDPVNLRAKATELQAVVELLNSAHVEGEGPAARVHTLIEQLDEKARRIALLEAKAEAADSDALRAAEDINRLNRLLGAKSVERLPPTRLTEAEILARAAMVTRAHELRALMAADAAELADLERRMHGETSATVQA